MRYCLSLKKWRKTKIPIRLSAFLLAFAVILIGIVKTFFDESNPEASSSPIQNQIEKDSSEENLIAEDGRMPAVIAAEQSTLAIDIDLTLQQDGEGYTFGNNNLTIHESGAYRFTDGTSDAPLSLSVRIEANASIELDSVILSSNSAMALAQDIEMNLYVSGENSLSSDKEAGIAVPKGARLMINGGGERWYRRCVCQPYGLRRNRKRREY